MRTAIYGVALALAGLTSALAQEPSPATESPFQWGGKTYRLEAPKLVAGEVDQAVWSPDGADIAYLRLHEIGTEVGLWNLKRGEGAIVATLGPQESLEQVVWLNAGHKALLVTRSKVDGRKDPTDLLTIHVADAEVMKAHVVWTEELPTVDSGTLAINPSPTLPHALITFQTAHGKTYLVLTQDAKAVVASADLAEAARSGQEVAGWSIHGTAMFGPNSDGSDVSEGGGLGVWIRGSTSARLSARPGWLRTTVTAGQDTGFQTLQNLGGTTSVTDEFSALVRLDLASGSRTLHDGDTALECIPSNGALRQIRFPGYYEAPDAPNIPLAPRPAVSDVHLGQSTATVQSLWLAPPQRAKEPAQGMLVSAQAEGAWLSPTGKTIAFTCHHALFLRRIVAGR